MENDIRLRRLQFRAWHRGTREADMMIGGFFDRYGKQWSGSELNWFERLLEERSEEHTSELQSLMRISYAVIFLNTKKQAGNTIRKTKVKIAILSTENKTRNAS